MDVRIRRRFAWRPVIVRGYVVWLQWYWEKFKFWEAHREWLGDGTALCRKDLE
jgi:hypothetical protein